MVFLYQSYEHVSMVKCTHIVSNLEVHIISKIITHKILFIINSFLKSHMVYLGLKNKKNYINHEYAIFLM
jgi:hypothetical protein